MWEDIRELGFFCILKHIPRVCCPTHAMPTCMNFFYRITDQHGCNLYVMGRSVLSRELTNWGFSYDVTKLQNYKTIGDLHDGVI